MTHLHIVITRPAGSGERMRYCFDGPTFCSCALQERRGGRPAMWRNIRRWEPKDRPAIPRDVRAEVRRQVRLAERRED